MLTESVKHFVNNGSNVHCTFLDVVFDREVFCHLTSFQYILMISLKNFDSLVMVSDISVTETITETEIIDPALTETETMLIYETEII